MHGFQVLSEGFFGVTGGYPRLIHGLDNLYNGLCGVCTRLSQAFQKVYLGHVQRRLGTEMCRNILLAMDIHMYMYMLGAGDLVVSNNAMS